MTKTGTMDLLTMITMAARISSRRTAMKKMKTMTITMPGTHKSASAKMMMTVMKMMRMEWMIRINRN